MSGTVGRGATVALGLLLVACSGPAPTDTPAVPTAVADPTPIVSADLAATPSLAAPTSAPAGTLVADIDVGGRTIHVECGGEARPGVPAILLESGLGGPISTWRTIRPAIERLSRVCAYDRAGLGLSGSSEATTRTVQDLADDLEAMLAGAGIDGPFLVVAHSMGPWVTTAFTARHPDAVVGLVLVDPRGPGVTERQFDALGEATPDEPAVVTEVRGWVDGGGFDDNPERLPFGPSEMIVGTLLGADGPIFGERPVTVLSADGTQDDLPPLPDDMRAAWWSIWLDEQQRYAAESTRGSVVSVAHSGHAIMDDQPAAVIDAIAGMLDAIASR